MGFFATNRMLREKIKDLEKSIEGYIGSSQILSQQLEKAEEREKILQENLFRVSGITLQENTKITVPVNRQPIKMHQKTANWKDVQGNLELKARQDYWEKKKSEEKVETLEKDVLES